MAISPVSGSTDISQAQRQSSFEGAVAKALAAEESGGLPAGFEDALIAGVIKVGGQMIIMPRANDILGEALSEE